MDLKKGQDINLDKLLKMSVKDKATAYFCGALDNYELGEPTEITTEMASDIVSSIKGKGIDIFKKYEFLYYALRRSMSDFIGSYYSLQSTTKELETNLSRLYYKEMTAQVLSTAYLLIDKIEHREIIDDVTFRSLAPLVRKSVTEKETLYDMLNGMYFSTVEGDPHYRLDPTEYLESKVYPLIDTYKRKLGNIKGVIEATEEWIKKNGAECIVSLSLETAINGIKRNEFYPEMLRYYSLSAVEEAKQKGEEVSPSRLSIAENFSIPTYEESPVNESMFNKVMKFLDERIR